MAVKLSALGGAGWQFFDDNGNILSGGKLYSYLAGTVTPATTYTGSTGATTNPNPIILDSAGRPPQEIWVTEGARYKFVLQTSLNVQLWVKDDIDPINDETILSIELDAFKADLANTSDPTMGDNLVGYRQSNSAGVIGTAVPGTVHTKLQEIVSVKDFGARGDGTTDDTLAIQNAINYVNADATASIIGRALYFPAGIYQISANLSASLKTLVNVKLYGDGGRNSVLRRGAGSAGDLFTLSSGTSVNCVWEFHDLGFVVEGARAAVRLQNANGAFFRDCYFGGEGKSGPATTGVLLNDCYANRFLNCFFRDLGDFGISTTVTGTNNLIVSSSSFLDCKTGVNLTVGGNNNVIRDSTFEGVDLPIGVTNYTSTLIEGNYIEGGSAVRFFFGGSNSEMCIRNNWLGDAAVISPFGNITGGSFYENTIYSCKFSADAATLRDFFIGHNVLLGGGPNAPATVPSTPWRAPSLLNGFANQGGNYQLAGYIKDSDGIVHLRGQLSGGSNNAVIFNLPVGYRPPLNEVFSTASDIAPGATIVEVRSNGDVVALFRDSSGGTGLSGVKFNCEGYTA